GRNVALPGGGPSDSFASAFAPDCNAGCRFLRAAHGVVAFRDSRLAKIFASRRSRTCHCKLWNPLAGPIIDQPNGNSHEPRDVPLTKKQNRAPKGKNVEQLYFQMTNGLTGSGPKTRSVRVKTCGSARRFQL